VLYEVYKKEFVSTTAFFVGLSTELSDKIKTFRHRTQKKQVPVTLAFICKKRYEKLLSFNHGAAFVRATSFAYAVSQFHFMALRAFNQARSSNLEVSTAHAFTRFRSSSLRYCHRIYTSLKRKQTTIRNLAQKI
jgi:hypothetical protein